LYFNICGLKNKTKRIRPYSFGEKIKHKIGYEKAISCDILLNNVVES